jgi:hypothetical protein
LSRESAAYGAGISPATLYVWMQEYPDFLEAIKKADAALEEKLIGNIVMASLDPKTWTAAAWILERKKPERWGKNAVPEREPEQPEDLMLGLDDGAGGIVLQVKPGASIEDARSVAGLENIDTEDTEDVAATES